MKQPRKRYYDHREELRLAKRATRHLAAAIRQMDARLVELRQEIAALQLARPQTTAESSALQMETAERLERLRAVLAFYADEKNYRREDHYSTPNQDYPYYTSPSKVMEDRGRMASYALAGCGPLSDPLQERIEQIEDRLSVERRIK